MYWYIGIGTGMWTGTGTSLGLEGDFGIICYQSILFLDEERLLGVGLFLDCKDIGFLKIDGK